MGIGRDLTVKASDQSEDPYALLEATEELILELSQSGQSQGFSTLLDSVQEAGGVESFVGKMYDPALMTGLSMGFVDVDKVLGGLQKKELTIVAARPSQGKSAYVLCVAINVSLADPEAVVAFFSVEMSKIALHKRLLAVMAGVNTRKAAEGWLSREERIRLGSAVVKAGDWNLEIDDSSMLTVTQMRAKSRRLKKQKGRLDLVIVDYLQLLQGTKRYNNREQEVASISRGLKALAKELDVPVMAVAMVGRGSERHGDKRPMLSDLRESGQIEGDADVILFIHRESYYHSEDDPDAEQGIAEILIAKNREGATGTRKLAYQAEYTRFSNLAVERY
jgi:replicative DNA helicase